MSTHFPLRRLFATALLAGAVAVAATGCGDDASGYLVKEDDGFQVKTYHSFGEPLDLPEFDEAAVEALPGA